MDVITEHYRNLIMLYSSSLCIFPCFRGKINELYRLENASILANKFLYDNFDNKSEDVNI